MRWHVRKDDPEKIRCPGPFRPQGERHIKKGRTAQRGLGSRSTDTIMLGSHSGGGLSLRQLEQNRVEENSR